MASDNKQTTTVASNDTKQGGKLKGTCKWFNSKKGFGFITPSAGGSDVFVHQTSIHAEGFRSLAEAEEVEYGVEYDNEQKRSKAVNVTGPNGSYVKGAPFRGRGRGRGRGGRGGRGRGEGRGGGRGGFNGQQQQGGQDNTQQQ